MWFERAQGICVDAQERFGELTGQLLAEQIWKFYQQGPVRNVPFFDASGLPEAVLR